MRKIYIPLADEGVRRYFSLSSFYYLDVPQRFDRNSDTGRTLRSLFGIP